MAKSDSHEDNHNTGKAAKTTFSAILILSSAMELSFRDVSPFYFGGRKAPSTECAAIRCLQSLLLLRKATDILF